jgi:hypothetical protein
MKLHLAKWIHRPHMVRLGVATALVVGVVGLTQCRMVDRNVTGVDVRGNATYGDDKDDRSRTSRCERNCERRYKDCRRAEDRRYDDAKDACKKLEKGEKGDRDECRREARRIHEQNVRECKAEKRACKRDCRYQEGAGSGGRSPGGPAPRHAAGPRRFAAKNPGNTEENTICCKEYSKAHRGRPPRCARCPALLQCGQASPRSSLRFRHRSWTGT